MAGKSKRLSKPMFNTGATTYYSSEFDNSSDYRRKTARGIHNQTRSMLRVPNKIKVTMMRKKQKTGSGGNGG